MGLFPSLDGLDPVRVWEGVVARTVPGERLSLAVVELEPGSVVPEHRHPNEQLGLVLRGSLRFRIGEEERELGPGGAWSIPPDTPHEVWAGPEGAVVVDVFAPPRVDWSGLETLEQAPRWP